MRFSSNSMAEGAPILKVVEDKSCVLDKVEFLSL